MISERLLKAAPNMKHEREYDLMREAAEVIDALVAALEKARSARRRSRTGKEGRVMEARREYDNGYSIRAALEPEYELSVDFEIIGDDGEVEITGSVKWDGCMNWETSPYCMFHFCRPADAERLASMFRDVWEIGRELMPKADEGYGT